MTNLKYAKLKKAQEELDQEELEPCPICGERRFWGEMRKIGCMECYFQNYLKRTKQE